MQRKAAVDPKSIDLSGAMASATKGTEVAIEQMTYSLSYYISGERVKIMDIPEGYEVENVAIAQLFQQYAIKQNRAIHIENGAVYFQHNLKSKRANKITLGIRLRREDG